MRDASDTFWITHHTNICNWPIMLKSANTNVFTSMHFYFQALQWRQDISIHLSLDYFWAACWGWHQRKHQSSTSMVLCLEIHWWFPSQRASNAEIFPIYYAIIITTTTEINFKCNSPNFPNDSNSNHELRTWWWFGMYIALSRFV